MKSSIKGAQKYVCLFVPPIEMVHPGLTSPPGLHPSPPGTLVLLLVYNTTSLLLKVYSLIILDSIIIVHEVYNNLEPTLE